MAALRAGPPPAPLIAADIGGTHARFALADPKTRQVSKVQEFQTADFATFDAALTAYLGGLSVSRPAALALGAAGPLADGRIVLTNAPWVLDPPAIAAAFGFSTVLLTNDLVAYAAGIASAPEGALTCLAKGAEKPNDVIVMALGTGLGAARFERSNGGAEIFPTEAGHVSYAPETAEEDALLQRLRQSRARPTFEQIISGSGLPMTYAALGGTAELSGRSEAVVARAKSGDAAAERTLHLAAASLATVARDLVLAHGGADAIVIGGGLGRALESYWRQPFFLERLRNAPSTPIALDHLGVYLVTASGLPLNGVADLAWGVSTCERIARFG